MTLSIRIFLFLVLAAAIPSAMYADPGKLAPHPFTHNGYSRPYLVYVPSHFGIHPPVVFVLGGVGSSAASTAQELGWTEEADRYGFLLVFPEPLPQDPSKPFVKRENTTFWEMQGSRTHTVGAKAQVDDDGYLMAVLNEILHTQAVDGKRVFLVGFSSGSGMVQLFASRHSRSIAAIAAIATPLMEPPSRLFRPVAVLYIHGDDDEQFSGFEVNSPDFATTPHGNWVTWGYLDGCQIQRARKTSWGVQFSWLGCRHHVPVIADFVHGLDHVWLNSKSSWNLAHRPDDPLDFTELAWNFFSSVPAR